MLFIHARLHDPISTYQPYPYFRRPNAGNCHRGATIMAASGVYKTEVAMRSAVQFARRGLMHEHLSGYSQISNSPGKLHS
jgi:hypothetical protein